jgi:hypothetical protein
LHAVSRIAKLAFYTAVNTEADFASGILALANAGAKVIDDDVGYADEPFFQDGVVAQAINQVSSQGVAGRKRRPQLEVTLLSLGGLLLMRWLSSAASDSL